MTLASDALAIARAGIRGVDASSAVRRNLRIDDDRLWVGSRLFPLRRAAGVHLVAFGKAAAAMAEAGESRVGDRWAGGLVVLPHDYPRPQVRSEVLRGAHPVPDRESALSARRVLRYVGSVGRADVVVFLISGGASAILEAPAAGVPLVDLRRAYELLLGSGAPIQSMNILRRHLSSVKGGQLALATRSDRFCALAISDVVGDAPSDIASGPTVGDPTTFADALRVLRTFGLVTRMPATVVRHLRAGVAGRVRENPATSDPRVNRGRFVLAATNRQALRASALAARARGYRVHLVSSTIVGESQNAGRAWGERLVRASRTPSPAPRCLLSGGETTVALGGSTGKGGRNQEFVLGVATVIAGRPGLLALSLGTDGVDGPTDAAGAWVDGTTIGRANDLGIDPVDVLARHDAYPALDRLGNLVITGPTGTNVMDLHVGLIGGASPRRAGSSRRSGARASRRRRS
jgi:hydroxypyruvate reductase